MTANTNSFTLADLVSIKHGFAFKGEYFRDSPTEYLLVTPGNFVVGGGFQRKRDTYYDGPLPAEYVLAPGDVIVTMTDLSHNGDTLGYPAIVPIDGDVRFLHNQRIGRVIVQRPDLVGKGYLYYRLCSDDYRQEVLASATGTTVHHTSPNRITAFELELPCLKDQQTIAALLGALDNRIELNRRMNRKLEALASALFRSWFIDFDPVVAKSEGMRPFGLSDEVAGLFPDAFDSGLPSGWRVASLGDIASAARSIVDPTSVSTDTPYIGLEHMPRRSISLDDHGASGDVTSSKFKFRRFDILFGKLRPYFHKVGVAPFDGLCSTDVVIVRPTDERFFALVLAITSSTEFVDYTDSTSGGTRMPRTDWPTMARYEFALPDERIAAEFDAIMRPLVERIVCNIQANWTLARVRDALLPPLISGELQLNLAEKIVEDVL